MTNMQDTQNRADPIAAAEARLDAALTRLERGMGGLTARVRAAPVSEIHFSADPPISAPPVETGRPDPEAAAREAALRAALQEAGDVMGELIAELREAIGAAETAAMAPAADGADVTGEADEAIAAAPTAETADTAGPAGQEAGDGQG